MITIDTKPIELSITSINDLLNNTKAILSEVSLFAKQLIEQRTARGVDWKGLKFKDYDPSYVKARHKKGLPTSHVDLFATGHMMGSIKTRIQGNTGRVYFASKLEAEKAGFHNAGDGVPERHFFDLTPANVTEAQEIITEWFDNGVK
jgi:hypothetical protein